MMYSSGFATQSILGQVHSQVLLRIRYAGDRRRGRLYARRGAMEPNVSVVFAAALNRCKAMTVTSENNVFLVAACGAAAVAVAGAAFYAGRRSGLSQTAREVARKYTTLPADAFDAAIVGAGPSGSACAFYLARAGARVALLEKEKFPRDKYCGDAVCTPAIRVLEDMGVLKELKDNDEAKFADEGGFVSPAGLTYIGKSGSIALNLFGHVFWHSGCVIPPEALVMCGFCPHFSALASEVGSLRSGVQACRRKSSVKQHAVQ